MYNSAAKRPSNEVTLRQTPGFWSHSSSYSCFVAVERAPLAAVGGPLPADACRPTTLGEGKRRGALAHPCAHLLGSEKYSNDSWFPVCSGICCSWYKILNVVIHLTPSKQFGSSWNNFWLCSCQCLKRLIQHHNIMTSNLICPINTQVRNQSKQIKSQKERFRACVHIFDSRTLWEADSLTWITQNLDFRVKGS